MCLRRRRLRRRPGRLRKLELRYAVPGKTLRGVHELTATGLGDVRAHNCSFKKGVQYCGKYYWGEAAAATTTDPPDSPATAAFGAAGSGAVAVSPGAPMTSTAASNGTISTAAPADVSPSAGAASPASSGDSKSSLPVRVSLPNPRY